MTGTFRPRGKGSNPRPFLLGDGISSSGRARPPTYPRATSTVEVGQQHGGLIMDTCYQCGQATDAVFRAVGADGGVVVLCVDCAVRGAILAEHERDPAAVAAGDQLVASVTRPGDVVVTASELLACRTADEVDALVERKEAEARLLDELEP